MMLNKVSFRDLSLDNAILGTVEKLGYQTPTLIQQQTIPLLLEGHDVFGQAQTGTGKTAAFALPFIEKLKKEQRTPQILVLTPTRELAIQVAESFKQYAGHIKNFNVAVLCGGQDYKIQLRQLKGHSQVIVGTPGRVIDHIERGSLDLTEINGVVLDEADEMLRMGFIDDVKWILEQTPDERQTALFSATMPAPILKIARQYMNQPKEIIVKNKSLTVNTIEQCYLSIKSKHKLDALNRLLELDSPNSAIVFVRTKAMTVQLTEQLIRLGHKAMAINGDLSQSLREQAIKSLKQGHVTLLIATDVAARGLDIKDISHVFNYDAPQDAESYVHRIGRTGRAGETGKAILFLEPREQYILRGIEKITRQKIDSMGLPSADVLNSKRIEKFKHAITDALSQKGIQKFHKIISEYQQEHDADPIDISAALAWLSNQGKPFFFAELKEPIADERNEKRANHQHKKTSYFAKRRMTKGKRFKSKQKFG